MRYGASALGLVSAMPSGPGVISEARIAEIAAQVPPHIATFLLTSKQSSDDIIAQHRRCRTTTIQLCDRLQQGSHAELKQALPGVELVQVIHISGPESFDEACAVAPHVDALLLDSGNPSAQVKTLGGTGRAHDWQFSAQICREIDKPVFLAGGLRPDNIAAAVQNVRPFGVDVCSGLRTNGRLDEGLLAAFFQALAK